MNSPYPPDGGHGTLVAPAVRGEVNPAVAIVGAVL